MSILRMPRTSQQCQTVHHVIECRSRDGDAVDPPSKIMVQPI